MLRLNPYRIGLRTIKTAVGMALGVIIAQLLGLDNYASSAILVVLCIKDTKIHSVHAIISRFISCLIAIGFGWAIFPLLGQHAWVLGLIVLFFIPVTVMINMQEGVVTSIVILLHFFNADVIDFSLVVNEVLLIIVGLAIAFTMNTVMPNLDHQLSKYKKEIEFQFKSIFHTFSSACAMHNNRPDVTFNSLAYTIQEAKSIAFKDVKNHFVRNENSYYHYFDMREDQLEILKRIKNHIRHINANDVMSAHVAQLFHEMAENVNENNYTALRLHTLYQIRLEIDQLPLPQTHEELLTRSSMIQILYDTEEYLTIKAKFGSLKMHHEI
ncbi:aromatic acid exporter family protein [Staphylococcus pseudintermedius]|uniref:aromatic acid exporter family protein n=1 Tax=Staphylococcus pseudintermedius TaxID=283734 RepID=UPI00103292EE|nr:aromatic acid exporter family protein [Staphylococcus pseudintermedius]EGQ2859987.1 aromatic acid exporter family protein [Staphylococcus pseudintermedius]EGQ3209533.1 aromatic acid exporter family protein [Staphylococcus pseudintermedius]EGQ3960040.1 aromatic acid exporter family protein [Staphylococcus pseudintermedius]EGQ4156838.1 aromatic acid exporter family protein [Staphylococcus pseudintermedius]EJY6916821.1 aromatic acid exporter family protein [Staphylococcus pseudintermedius]